MGLIKAREKKSKLENKEMSDNYWVVPAPWGISIFAIADYSPKVKPHMILERSFAIKHPWVVLLWHNS